jgi:hypothetical protein
MMAPSSTSRAIHGATAVEASEAAAADFDMTLLKGATTMDEVRAIVLDLTDSEHASACRRSREGCHHGLRITPFF